MSNYVLCSSRVVHGSVDVSLHTMLFVAVNSDQMSGCTASTEPQIQETTFNTSTYDTKENQISPNNTEDSTTDNTEEEETNAKPDDNMSVGVDNKWTEEFVEITGVRSRSASSTAASDDDWCILTSD